MKCQVVSCAVVVCSRDLDPQQRNTCHRSDCAFGEQYTCVSHRNGGNELWCQQSVCNHQALSSDINVVYLLASHTGLLYYSLFQLAYSLTSPIASRPSRAV